MTYGTIASTKKFLKNADIRKTTKRKKLRRSLVVQSLENRMVLDGTYFDLSGGSLSQDWSDAGLITVNDNWANVPSIIGFLGDSNPGSPTAVDPRTLTADVPSVAVDVIANQTNPNTNSSGGVAEFAIANPVVALQGSGTADAPYLQLHLNTTGRTAVRVQANLRDIDGSADNSAQQINVQYRVGTNGAWTNVTGGYFSDTSTGPSDATAVTALDVTLPGAADNVGQVQVRIMTTNAANNDEWIGIDDILVTSNPAGDLPPSVLITPVTPNPRTTSVSSVQIVFNEAVQNFDLSDLSLTFNGGANLLTGSQTLTTSDNITFTLGNLAGITGVDGVYSLVLAVSNIQDLSSNPLIAGDVENWTLDSLAPTVVALTPPDNSIGVFSEDNLLITFSEPVVKGTGLITVHQQSDNSVVASIDVASTEVTVFGNFVRINPAADLPLSSGLYVNVPATAFTDSLLNPFAGILGTTAWSFSTTGVSSIIAQQDFNSLPVQTANTDTLATGSQLTNTGSFNVGGPQLDFSTFWFNTRGSTDGPAVGGTDTQDFIGVNSFGGASAPGVSANGTTVGATETNFEINDADGEVRVVFEPINLVGFSDRFLSFNYWISASDFEAGDILRATISDGVNSINFLDLDSVAMNANESADNGTANWRTASINLENLIDNFGYGTTMTLTVAVSNTDDTGADNVFIDNILVRGTSEVVAPEIDVRGNLVSIVDGDVTPSVTDATSFGSAILNSAPTTATFTIANTGNSDLILTGTPLVSITGSSNFTITTQPTSPVTAGSGTTTFVVTFTPTTLGLQTATISIDSNDADESPYTFDVSGTVAAAPASVFINEVDADTLGADTAEFIELYDGGVGNTSLTGLVVVLYNGSNDLSYAAYDLDGFSTDANGFFLIGNTAVPGVGITFANNFLQNGADAVAVFLGDATSFPNGTALTLTNLIDAVVYDTADADDAGLLTLLLAGGQIDETGATTAEANSVSRVPNGGTLRDSTNFVAQPPTPGTTNSSGLVTPTITATPLTKVYDGLAFSITATADDGPAGFAADSTPASFVYTYYAGPGLTGGVITAPKNVGSYSVDVSYAGNVNFNPVASTAFDFTITPASLSVTGLTGANKVYDATTVASATGTATVTPFGTDVVTVTGTPSFSFADKLVGTGKPITATGYTLTGADAGNYVVVQPTGLTGNITPASLTVTGLTGVNRVYDATAVATVTGTPTVAPLLTDVVTVTGTPTFAFANKSVGNGKAITALGYTLTGTDAANYTIVQPTGLSADITPFQLVGSITAADKVFDGNTTASILTRTLSGVIGTDVVTYTGGTATFDTAAVGTGKTVTATGLSLTGADAVNYSVNTTATTTASITPAISTIANRAVFYNNSPGFGTSGANNSPTVNPSAAIDTTKSALRNPGASSTFANYTNYSRGLNGLVVDISNLPGTTTNAQMLASLQFAQWNGIVAGGFSALPVAAVPTVSILPGVGTSGSARVRITFPDNTLQNTWLRVTVLANAQTNLASTDVFYFGNVIGELNFANTATRLRVNGQDTNLILGNQSPGANSVDITSIYDVNRDRRVNGQDTNVLLTNQQAGGIVAPITVPVASTLGSDLATPLPVSAKTAPNETTEFSSLSTPPVIKKSLGSSNPNAPLVGSSGISTLVAVATGTSDATDDSDKLKGLDQYFSGLGGNF